MLVSLFLLIFVCYALVWWFLLPNRRLLRVASQTPTLSGCLPLIGHLHKIAGDSVNALKFLGNISKETNENGGVMKGWFGSSLFYVITDPDDAQTILNSCLKKHYVYRFAQSFVGNGLLTARSLKTWKRHRKLLIPAFNQQILDGFMGVFNEQSRCLVDRLAQHVDKEEFEHWPYLAYNALETICRTALGVPEKNENLVGKEYGLAVQTMFTIVMERAVKVWLHNETLFNMSRLKQEHDRIEKIFHKMSSDVLEKRKNAKPETTSYGNRFKPFLDLMMDLSAQGLLTDQEVREELDTMIIAGHDTSSSALLYTMFLLGSFPEVQERVYNELKEVMEGSDRDVTKEDLPKLIYMEAVIKEALRLYPVGAFILRYANNETKLKNYTVPIGCTIIVSIWGIHRNACWGDDVEAFKPERWLNPATLPKSPAAFAAFSLGRRNCIGKTYAFMAMKTTLTHVLRRYRIASNLPALKLKVDTILKPASGCKVSLTRRQ